jgi:hypothetical protein
LSSETARRFLVAFVSIILSLALLEIPAFIKVLDYGRIIGPASGDVFAATNKGDPELLHIHPPHSHFSGEARGGNITSGYRIPPSDMTVYRWDVKYDQNGFRNEQNLKSADMVVIGDSFVEDITIPTAELTTSLLAHLQGKVVANLGQYGYGPLEELAVLKRFALPLQPRTVVWMFFEGNDLRDVIHYRKATAEERKPASFWLALWHRSFTYNALAQIYVRYRRASRPSGVKRSGVFQTANGDMRTMYFVYPSAPFTKDDLSALDETVRTLAAVQDLCAAQGSRLIFVFIPTKFRVFHEFCKFPPGSECRNWTVNDLPERFAEAIGSISFEVGYLDLTPHLVDAVKRGTLPYNSDDDHWSPEGHKIAAEAINDYLLSTHKQSLPE